METAFMIMGIIFATIILVRELQDKSSTLRCVVLSFLVLMTGVLGFIGWLAFRYWELRTGRHID